MCLQYGMHCSGEQYIRVYIYISASAVVCICALRCCTLQSNYAPRVKRNLLKLSTLCVEIRLKNAKCLKIRLNN